MVKDSEIKLMQRNIRPTAMRMLVLDVLLKMDTAISLRELEDMMEHSDRITLYRTLKTFQENGMVHSIDDGTGAPKYALCEDSCNCDMETDLHVHFHCKACRETFCLPKYKIPEIKLPSSFSPEDASLVVKGTCANCAA